MSSAIPATGLDSSGHPAVETISDYLEDLLAPDLAAQVHAHFATCAECLETRDAIDEIRSLLGHAVAPRLPSDVGIRIDAALAAEAVLSASGLETPATPHVSPASPPSRRPAAPSSSQRPPNRADTSAPPARSRAGRRVRRAVVGLAALAVIAVASVTIMHTSGGSGTSASAGVASGASVQGAGRAAGPTFTDSAFAQQVHQLLLTPTPAGQSQERSQGTRQEPTSPYAPKALPQQSLPACVIATIGRAGEHPLTFSLGSYQGLTVYAVIYAGGADPAHSVDAYLVDASCANPGSGQPSRGILLQRTVPRD